MAVQARLNLFEDSEPQGSGPPSHETPAHICMANVRVDPEWLAWAAKVKADGELRVVPIAERAQYAATTSLRQFVADCTAGHLDPIGIGNRRRPGTYQIERGAINRWEKYTRPDDWPASRDWPGPPLLLVSDKPSLFTDFVQRCAATLSASTVNFTSAKVSHLFRHAVSVGAMPEWRPPRNMRLKETGSVRMYTPDQVASVVLALSNRPAMRIAFCLSLQTGIRHGDLLRLTWSNLETDALGRSLLVFTARKTSKLQAVPMADVTIKLLNQLRTSPPMESLARDPSKAMPVNGGLIFPELASSHNGNPERSRKARAATRQLKQILTECGIPAIRKPWHAARVTCNERMESHKPGSGQFLLGHSLTGVNARSYREPTQFVFDAVNSVPQYPCFET